MHDVAVDVAVFSLSHKETLIKQSFNNTSGNRDPLLSQTNFDILWGGFVWGFLSRGLRLGFFVQGVTSGVFCPGGLCPRTVLTS